MAAQRSQDDQTFLDHTTARSMEAFRNFTFPDAFVAGNPSLFLNHDWVNVTGLRAFLLNQESATKAAVKLEIFPTTIKSETEDQPTITVCAATKTRTSHADNSAREIIEILDSDTEDEAPVISKAALGLADGRKDGAEKCDSSIDVVKDEAKDQVVDLIQNEQYLSAKLFSQVSTTRWDDTEITSKLIPCDGSHSITKLVTVAATEYINELPSVFPLPEALTAFIVDLRDPKFDLYDEDGKLYTPDALIKDKDQDSWEGSTGTGDSKVAVRFHSGATPILCRRSRLTCKGIHACSQVDQSLLHGDRYELDPTSRDAIFAAQRKTRTEEGNTVEKKTVTFFNVISTWKCNAVASDGKLCTGVPMMKKKAEGMSRGHNYWIACSGWTPSFKKDHRTQPIQDDVDEDVLAKLLAGKPVADDGSHDTSACSRVVPSHIGGKLKHCPHPHIVSGCEYRSPIERHTCNARRTIYVPVDPQFRFALVIHHGTKEHPEPFPHNHPMPVKSKMSIETSNMYRKCIQAASSVGSTVQKIDNAMSTKLVLGGKNPSQYNAALANKRVKRTLVHKEKIKKYPAGLGIAGAFDLYYKDIKKPAEERYIQNIVITDDGGILIMTFVPSLLALIHEVVSFECDVTFKRVVELNEWELVVFYPPVQRAVTIGRIYTDRAHTNHYTRLFDELQGCVLRLTGRPLAFKRLTPGGNLLCMNADMEAAQVLGVGRSFMRTNQPGYSGITTSKSEELVQYFVRVCLTHSKRGVLDFKSLVSSKDYKRIIDFPYLQSTEELDDFTDFIKKLNIKKIQDWWTHKTNSDWIPACIIKSQSKILPEHWSITPGTTNTGEGQHHWTNLQSGIKLSLVEGIESARIIDEQVAREIEDTLRNGILTNSQNELVHRMSRNAQRTTATLRKAAAANATDDGQPDKAKSKQRKPHKGPSRADSEQSSSSGRVKSRPATKLAKGKQRLLDTVSVTAEAQTVASNIPSYTTYMPAASTMFQSIDWEELIVEDGASPTEALLAPAVDPLQSDGEFEFNSDFDFAMSGSELSDFHAGDWSDFDLSSDFDFSMSSLSESGSSAIVGYHSDSQDRIPSNFIPFSEGHDADGLIVNEAGDQFDDQPHGALDMDTPDFGFNFDFDFSFLDAAMNSFGDAPHTLTLSAVPCAQSTNEDAPSTAACSAQDNLSVQVHTIEQSLVDSTNITASKKRSRDEADEKLVVAEGSRRVRTKTARAIEGAAVYAELRDLGI